MSSTSGENPTREWVLDPETEYRFELDSGATLAITVCIAIGSHILPKSTGADLSRS